MVRWFRNTLNSAILEFGCELLSDAPEAAAAAAENAPEGDLLPVLVLSEEEDAAAPAPQLAAPAGAFALEQAVSLRRRASSTGFRRAHASSYARDCPASGITAAAQSRATPTAPRLHR